MSSLPRIPSLFSSPGEVASLGGTALASVIRSLGGLDRALTQEHRLLQLRVGYDGAALDGALFICHADINEQACEDDSLHMRLLCMSTRPDLPEAAFIGQPASVSLITDRGTQRHFNGIIRRAIAGPWSGSEQGWLIEVVDFLTYLDEGRGERIFLGGSVVDLIDGVLRLSLQDSNLASVVDWVLPVQIPDYPERKFRMQVRESTRAFILRHARRYGMGWRVRPGTKDDPEGRGHTIEFFNDYSAVPANDAGTVDFQRDWATQARDAINEWMSDSTVTPCAVDARGWDHQTRQTDRALHSTWDDRGTQGTTVPNALLDQHSTPTHWGHDGQDFQRIAWCRTQYHAMRSRLILGSGSVRDAHCFTRIDVTGLPHDPFGRTPTSVVFVRVRHLAQNNFGPETDQRLQAVFARAGWTVERPIIGNDEDRSHYGNTFTAVPAGMPIVPHFDLDTHWPKVHSTTAIVIGTVEGDAVHCDEFGRYAVCFPAIPVYQISAGVAKFVDQTGETLVPSHPKAVTSAYVPLATTQASSGFGLNTPPRPGDQMLVAFLHGSPDHPVLTGGLHSKWYPHSRAEGEQAMPGNRHIASLREKEVGSDRASELLIDSTPGQTRVQVDSDHAHSRIAVGFQTTPRRNGQAEPIGEGIYQSTDAAHATRAARGILQSAWARLNGSGKQLDYQEALNLMETGLALFKSMGEYAAQHQGAALDTDSQTELKDAAANWQAGTNTDPKSHPKDTAIIALTAPQGIAANTPKTIAQFAGENVDTVAQQHMQLVAGQRYTVNAGQGITQFAHDGGIRHIAHKGQYLVQAQHGDIVSEAVGDIRVSTANGTIRHYAKVHELIAADGSFIRIGDGITFGTNGAIKHQAASFPHSGPATMSAEAPAFNADATSLRFVVRLATVDGPPAPLTRYEIEMSDGSRVSGTTDAEGATSVQMKDAMHIARITLFDPEE